MTNGIPQPTDQDGRISVLIELRQEPGMSGSFGMGVARSLEIPGFRLDEEYEPVSFQSGGEGLAASGETVVVRGTVSTQEEIESLQALPEVDGVWRDTPIAPFPLNDPLPELQQNPAAASCPVPPCDCDPRTPKGNMADVANYLGVNRIWSAGIRGQGIVVGVLDGGITAQGRPVKDGETSRRIPRVIGGWPTSDWGTEARKWGEHGNMCATDVLGMAPEAQIYDLRISGGGGSPGTISRALQCFSWAISQYRTNGTPQILTNSWGIFQEAWDRTYARNPNHPFTRKVVEAINEGIIVLFAAGNCGDTCPDGRCGSDVGPGRSIWGANGHPAVMTVGAVNTREQFIGYSSRGPAALDPNKPDFCSISHFRGYFTSDSGTSAATPILAGVTALFKQAKAGATQNEIKGVLRATAKDIGPGRFDQHTGAGIVQAHAAYQRLVGGTNTRVPPCPRPTLVPPCPRPTRVPLCRTRVPQLCPTRVPQLCRTRIPQLCRTRIPQLCRTRIPQLCRTRIPQLCRTRIPQLCPPRTTAPPCPPRTRPPACPIRTRPPACPIRTRPPACPIRTLPPACPIRTLPPTCRPPRQPLGFEGEYLYDPYETEYDYGSMDPWEGLGIDEPWEGYGVEGDWDVEASSEVYMPDESWYGEYEEEYDPYSYYDDESSEYMGEDWSDTEDWY